MGRFLASLPLAHSSRGPLCHRGFLRSRLDAYRCHDLHASGWANKFGIKPLPPIETGRRIEPGRAAQPKSPCCPTPTLPRGHATGPWEPIMVHERQNPVTTEQIGRQNVGSHQRPHPQTPPKHPANWSGTPARRYLVHVRRRTRPNHQRHQPGEPFWICNLPPHDSYWGTSHGAAERRRRTDQ